MIVDVDLLCKSQSFMAQMTQDTLRAMWGGKHQQAQTLQNLLSSVKQTLMRKDAAIENELPNFDEYDGIPKMTIAAANSTRQGS